VKQCGSGTRKITVQIPLAIISNGFALGMEARRAETAKLALFTTARPEGNALRIRTLNKVLCRNISLKIYMMEALRSTFSAIYAII
jgi:hypothetical protein